MLVIEECANTRAVTIFVRGGNKMVSIGLYKYLNIIYIKNKNYHFLFIYICLYF